MTFTTIGCCVPVRSRPETEGTRMEVLAFSLSTGDFIARQADRDGALYVCQGMKDARGTWYQIVREYSRDDLTFLLTLPGKPAL